MPVTPHALRSRRLNALALGVLAVVGSIASALGAVVAWRYLPAASS